jgi:uncharacterized protein (DUF2235 family)
MGRKIVLLSDGTGNSAAKVWRTNVWRVFESLDLSSSDQVAFYDDGVGTSSFKPLAILGGAFGYGLKRNVIDIYKFACRNYRNDDDEIFGFGFSRGAFTMRVVAGLILNQGLVVPTSEDDLDAKALAAYRAFRREKFHTIWRYESVLRWLRDLILRSDYSKTENRQNVKIRFLGLWDTVAAYGLPVEEMTRGISQWIWPLLLPDCILHDDVQRACHALSLDDERETFHPTLWDESEQNPVVPRADGKRYISDERISQIWFAGVHSNVGGGYPDDSLAHIPLVWMMTEAQACGLVFKPFPNANPQTFSHAITGQDKDGRLYDSRQGLGGYYRYGPRNVKTLCEGLIFPKSRPKIHETVLMRIGNNAHLYAPKGLPAEYDIVTLNGEILPHGKNPFESPSQRGARFNFQENVWNIIWLRRIVYFLTAFVSFFLATFPLFKAAPQWYEFTTPFRRISDTMRAMGSLLPSAATPWLDGYARQPGIFLVALLFLIIFLKWNQRLAAQIDSKMGVYWRKALNNNLTDPGTATGLIYRMRTGRRFVAVYTALKKYGAPAFFAGLFLYLGLTFTSHVLFNIQDDIGWVCQETPVKYGPDKNDPYRTVVTEYNGLKNLEDRGQSAIVEFNTSDQCKSTGVWLERGGKYLIQFSSTDSFMDGDIPARAGFYTFDMPMSWEKLRKLVYVPLGRELIRPWFRIVARIGGKGSEEAFLDPDPTDKYLIDEVITATRDGELFLFVNDAVIGVPGFYDYFYKNNQGSAKVTIMRK